MSRDKEKNINEKEFLKKIEICKRKYKKFVYDLILEEGMIALPMHQEIYNEAIFTKPATMKFYLATQEDIDKVKKELGITLEKESKPSLNKLPLS